MPAQEANEKKFEVVRKILSDYFDKMSEKHQAEEADFESTNISTSNMFSSKESVFSSFANAGLFGNKDVADAVKKSGININDLGYGIKGAEFERPLEFDPAKNVYFAKGLVNCVIQNEKTGEIVFEKKYPAIRLYNEKKGNDAESKRLLEERIKRMSETNPESGLWHESNYKIAETTRDKMHEKAKKDDKSKSAEEQAKILENLERLKSQKTEHTPEGIPLPPSMEEPKAEQPQKKSIFSRIKGFFGRK
jgi:hypothetical protein